jgi:predicted acylesterase/phospholipase RssA
MPDDVGVPVFKGRPYQPMPPPTLEEYEALHESISLGGVLEPIVVDENSNVIDGHYRQEIAKQLGRECPTRTVAGLSDDEKIALAITLNVHRRHLTAVQRRELLGKSIAAAPEQSDREHGRRTHTDHKTAASVRAELVESGEIPHFSERVDPRTGNRSQPAKRRKAKTDNVIPITGPRTGSGTTDSKSPPKQRRESLNPTLTQIALFAGRASAAMSEIRVRADKVRADSRYRQNPKARKDFDRDITASVDLVAVRFAEFLDAEWDYLTPEARERVAKVIAPSQDARSTT